MMYRLLHVRAQAVRSVTEMLTGFLAVPTRKEVQIMLAHEELTHEDPEHLGVSEWISTGLQIEETKYVRSPLSRIVF